MTKSINGKSIASRITAGVQREINELGLSPGLGVVLVGDDQASHLYVRLKETACMKVGIRFEKTTLPSDASRHDVVDVI